MERPPNSFTCKEYQTQAKLTRNQAQARLQKLKAAGKIRPIQFKVRKDNGVVQKIDGYQLVEEAIEQKRETTVFPPDVFDSKFS